jgi:hypothetical protein
MVLALIGTADKPPSALVSFITFAVQAKACLPDGLLIRGSAYQPVSLQ